MKNASGTLLKNLLHSAEELRSKRMCRLGSHSIGKPHHGPLGELFSLPTNPSERNPAANSNALISTFCSELRMGESALHHWRSKYLSADTYDIQSRKGCPLKRIVTSPQNASNDDTHEVGVGVQRDRDLVLWAVRDAGCVISPFVNIRSGLDTLVPGSTFIAKKQLPAGVFLFSVPMVAAIESTLPATNALSGVKTKDDSQTAGDVAEEVARFFLQAEDIALQIALAAREVESNDGAHLSIQPYASYLMQTVHPPHNLPFMDTFGSLDSPDKSAASFGDLLWSHFHKLRLKQPLNLAMFRRVLMRETPTEQYRLVSASLRSKDEHKTHMTEDFSTVSMLDLSQFLPPLEGQVHDEYLWLMSVVFSRRIGGSLQVPLVDKLNHCVPEESRGATAAGEGSQPTTISTVVDANPNAVFSVVADRNHMRGVDVFDNIVAGVPESMLYEPYVHVVSLRDIKKGEPITLAYTCDDESSPLSDDPRRREDTSSTAISEEQRRIWQLNWGFVPQQNVPLCTADLDELSVALAERRLERRSELFPPSQKDEAQAQATDADAQQFS